MQEVIEQNRRAIIQIATPYNVGGTGFYLRNEQLIVTNEHIVRDNREVIVEGTDFPRQMARVVFVDTYYDIAFLTFLQPVDMEGAVLANEEEPMAGARVVAIGHPFGLSFSSTIGILSNNRRETDDFYLYQHDAALNPGNSGGPLLNDAGEVIGINIFDIKEANDLNFSLPVKYLRKSLDDFLKEKNKGTAARCFACQAITYEQNQKSSYCSNCGAHLVLPSDVKEYEAVGTGYTIELLLEALGHNVKLARRGLHNWEITEGSAKIEVSYHEDSGLVTADAHLCQLPDKHAVELYQFLLEENYKENGLTFSVKGRDIILSILIYDRYLNVETSTTLFQELFERADFYDNVIVDKFGARWKAPEEN